MPLDPNARLKRIITVPNMQPPNLTGLDENGNLMNDSPLYDQQGPTDQGGMNMLPTPILDQYRNQLGLSPNRADFQPDWKHRLLGMAVGAGVGAGTRNGAQGYLAARDYMDRPFNQAQEDYTNKMKNLGTGAGIEERMNYGLGRMQTMNEANDIRWGQLQNAIDKNENIKEQKINELAEKSKRDAELANEFKVKADHADAVLAEMQRRNTDVNTWHNAQIQAQNARHQADMAAAAARLSEQHLMNQKRAAYLEGLLKNNKIPYDTESDTSLVTDDKGNVTGKKVITKKTPSNATSQDDPLGIGR